MSGMLSAQSDITRISDIIRDNQGSSRD